MFVINKPTSTELAGLYAPSEGYELYVSAQRPTDVTRHVACLEKADTLVRTPPGERLLFDVGAGAGAFLALARSCGFAVAGNEISEPARRMCSDRQSIELSGTDIVDEKGQDRFDVITMWCVLAHVHDPSALLAATFRLLRPGGILYLSTPRWCTLDKVGVAVERMSGGALPQIIDRRINTAHLRLFGRENLAVMLRSSGYQVLEVSPKCELGLNTAAYLESMQIPLPLRRPLEHAFDRLIDRNLFPRNILDVYARKPMVSAA